MQAENLKPVFTRVIAVVLCLFVLISVNTTLLGTQPNLAVFGMLGILLVLVHRPVFKRWSDSKALQATNLALMLCTVLVFGYIFVQSEQLCQSLWVDGTLLGNRAGNETTFDFVVAGIGLLLVLEATRRAIGWTLPILCSLFIAFAYFGPELPDWLFPHAGASWQDIAQKSFLQEGGVFGVALKVMFKYVFLFVLFGTLLEQTGATGYVIRFAQKLFGTSPGAPAKVAVLSSGLMGSLSGSAVANTATTGTLTIPLMKSSGFDSESAAGIEAAASSGGALMPPIMGAGAYMMLELVPDVDYVQIIKAALIPAVLYYVALLLTVHFQSKRLATEATADQPATTPADDFATSNSDENDGASQAIPSSYYQGIVFFGSFVILIAMLLYGFTPFRAVSYSLVGVLVLSLFHPLTRLTPTKLLQAMEDAARGGIALIVAASCVGIILGLVSLTGLGVALPAKVQALSSDSALLAMVLLMVSTIILGMGLPSAVCYLLMATLVGTVLETLNTPTLAAHLFIFYFGMMSMVTPPVALAAYAAAAIAKSDVIRSAFAAFRFALVGFALPYAFVLKPALLMLGPQDGMAAEPLLIVGSTLIIFVAIYGLAAAIAGFAFHQVPTSLRIILIMASMAIFFTRWTMIETVIQLIAAGIIILLIGLNYRGNTRLKLT